MANRKRTRAIAGPEKGTWSNWVRGNSRPALYTKEPGLVYLSTREDTGTFDNYFRVDREEVSSHLLNQSAFWSYYGDTRGADLVWTDWPLGGLSNVKSHLSDPSEPNIYDLAVRALGRTNPSRPLVDVNVFIGELRDLPTMVKEGGQSVAEKWASGTLRREFGFNPFMGDLKKLMKFKEKVQNRVKLLEKFKKGPLLRKAKLYESTKREDFGDDAGYYSQSYPFDIITWPRCVVTQRLYWGYVKYTPTSEMKQLLDDDDAIHARAKQIILGSTVDWSTVWNLTPWSWLIDWFGNVGDYLAANRNLVPVSASTPRVCMTTTTTADYIAGFNMDNVRVRQRFSAKRTTKQRQVVSAAFPSADLPLLTQRQINILGSLFALKGTGGYRG